MTAKTKLHTLYTLLVTVGLAIGTTVVWLKVAPLIEKRKLGEYDKIGMLILLDQLQHKK